MKKACALHECQRYIHENRTQLRLVTWICPWLLEGKEIKNKWETVPIESDHRNYY